MTRLSKNLIYNVAGQGLVLVLSLIAVRFIFRRLGDDVFGIIFFNLVLTGVLTSALELGVSATIVREISSHWESEPDYIRKLIRTASTLYWGGGVLLVVVIWVTAPLLVTHWVNLKTLDPGTAATTLRILSVTALVILPKGLYASLFRGRQVMVVNNVIDVGAAVIQQAGILLVLLGGGGVYLVAGWIAASALLGAIAYVLTAARLFGWSPLSPSFYMEAVRRNLGFTGQMMVISLMSLVHVQAAQVIVSKLLPISEFGFYSLAASTVNRATFVTGAAAQAAFPSFSSLHAAGDRPALMQQYRKLQDLVSYGTLPLFMGICFVALPVYTYVINASVAQSLLLPTAFLALGSWMSATLNMPHMLALAMGRPDIAVRTTSLALLVVLPVTVLLIVRFGIAGAGFSWVFYHTFVYVVMIPRVCRYCLQIAPSRWYGQVARVAALAAATYGVAWLVIVIPTAYSVPFLALAYVLASIVFLIGARLLIGPDLKNTLRNFQAQVLPALTARF